MTTTRRGSRAAGARLARERKQALAALQRADWQGVLEIAEAMGERVAGDAEMARAAGLAANALGRRPYDRAMMGRALTYLAAAWRLGNRESEVAWSLAGAQYELGACDDAVGVLTTYIAETADADERVRAAAFLGQVREVMGGYEEAVAAHQAGLSGLGGNADPAVRFDSYLNVHLARAYGRSSAASQWRVGALGLWDQLAPEQRTAHRAIWLLRSADLATGDPADHQPVLELGERLLKLIRDRGGESDLVDHLRSVCSLERDLYAAYDRAGQAERSAAMLAQARATIEKLQQVCDRLRAELCGAQSALFAQVHDLGYQCREAGRPHEALLLLQEAEELGPLHGATCFVLSALTLECTDDRAQSLAYLSRAARDDYWAPHGACCSLRAAFDQDGAFDAVREDPEFLAVVDTVAADPPVQASVALTAPATGSRSGPSSSGPPNAATRGR